MAKQEKYTNENTNYAYINENIEIKSQQIKK